MKCWRIQFSCLERGEPELQMGVIFEFVNNILLRLYWITTAQRTGLIEGIQIEHFICVSHDQRQEANKPAQNCHLPLYRS
jgi:hypothetical protein